MRKTIVAFLVLVPSLCSAADIKPALVEVFGNEGGYQCMRHDSGNWTGGKVGAGVLRGTKYGIAAASYPKEDIKNLTITRAANIYHRDFWKPLGLDRVKSQIIATEIFDGAINMGVGTQARLLQESINLANGQSKDIAIDGRIGGGTIAALNACDQPTLYACLIGQRFGRYKFLAQSSPRLQRFFQEWVGHRIRRNVIKAVHEVDRRSNH